MLETTINENYYTLYSNYTFRFLPDRYSDIEWISESIDDEYTLSIGGNEIADLYSIVFESPADLFMVVKSVLYSRS